MSRLKGFKLTEEHKMKIGLAKSIALKGHKLSKETKLKKSIALKEYYKTHQNPMVNKIHSLETKLKMRNSHLGKKYKPMSLQGKNNISKALKGLPSVNKGRKHTLEAKKHMSEAKKRIGIKPPSRKGSHMSEESKRQISNTMKILGLKPPYRKGFTHTEKTKNKLREAHLGEKAYNWLGGVSKKDYASTWTETFKKSIRERDNYTCKICNKEGNNVHHIDYDKKNCSLNNLITLCQKCHLKTNINRSYWKIYFYIRKEENGK